MILINSKLKTFSVRYLAAHDWERDGACLVNLRDEKIILIGGSFEIDLVAHRSLTNVASYDLAKNAWKNDMPSLNEERAGASACLLGNCIYVFGGKRSLLHENLFGPLISEKLNLHDLD